MGTAGFGHGNASPVAEFNVYHDAEAYRIFTESGVPVTALGFDLMSLETAFTKAELQALESKGGMAAYVGKAFSGLIRFNETNNGMAIAANADGVLMACVLWDGFLQKAEDCHAVVMTEDNAAYGQVILYKQNFFYDSGVQFDDYSFRIATRIADITFKDRLFALLTEQP